jgi:ferritin-like metal-binding protein YciE
MPETGTLHDAFVDELRDIYDGERQLTKALAKLAKTATDRRSGSGRHSSREAR